jgi:hypothetical protein
MAFFAVTVLSQSLYACWIGFADSTKVQALPVSGLVKSKFCGIQVYPNRGFPIHGFMRSNTPQPKPCPFWQNAKMGEIVLFCIGKTGQSK